MTRSLVKLFLWYNDKSTTLDLAEEENKGNRVAKRKRMGRPPLPRRDRKRHVIAFKLDDGEIAALKRKARELGVSISETIREAIRRFVL